MKLPQGGKMSLKSATLIAIIGQVLYLLLIIIFFFKSLTILLPITIGIGTGSILIFLIALYSKQKK